MGSRAYPLIRATSEGKLNERAEEAEGQQEEDQQGTIGRV